MSDIRSNEGYQVGSASQNWHTSRIERNYVRVILCSTQTRRTPLYITGHLHVRAAGGLIGGTAEKFCIA